VSTAWNAGYITDVNYTSGYYGELNPLRCRLPLTLSGHHAPKVENACELGFGLGLSVAIHAAAQPGVNWYGTDFNPSQTAFAKDLVRLSGADAKLYDEAFADFCNRSDLPDFDFIGLHGIWTWISNENRGVLVDFVRRKLRPGGVLYMSYNTDPGWAALAPIRHLLKRHADVMGTPGQGLLSKADGALDFTEAFLALDPRYIALNPLAKGHFEQLRGQERQYLVHEYLNGDWDPMYFSELERWLSVAKVGYVCSAHALDALHEVNMTPQQAEFIQRVPDMSLRETLKDFCTNQQFRRDYWIRGPRKLTTHEQLDSLKNQLIVLPTPEASLPKTVRGANAEAGLVSAIYDPIYELLLDHKVHTVGELEAHVAAKGVGFTQLTSALTILFGLGVLQPASADHEAAKPRCLALNKAIAQRSQSIGDLAFFASPYTGGGVSAPRLTQLFWLSKQEGGKTADDWAAYAWRCMAPLNQAMVKDGVALTGEDNLVELKARAADWGARILPIWEAVGI
jgi:SAM-dependent methyltransferase